MASALQAKAHLRSSRPDLRIEVIDSLFGLDGA